MNGRLVTGRLPQDVWIRPEALRAVGRLAAGIPFTFHFSPFTVAPPAPLVPDFLLEGASLNRSRPRGGFCPGACATRRWKGEAPERPDLPREEMRLAEPQRSQRHCARRLVRRSLYPLLIWSRPSTGEVGAGGCA